MLAALVLLSSLTTQVDAGALPLVPPALVAHVDAGPQPMLTNETVVTAPAVVRDPATPAAPAALDDVVGFKGDLLGVGTIWAALAHFLLFPLVSLRRRLPEDKPDDDATGVPFVPKKLWIPAQLALAVVAGALYAYFRHEVLFAGATAAVNGVALAIMTDQFRKKS